jgi:hypothetical protein
LPRFDDPIKSNGIVFPPEALLDPRIHPGETGSPLERAKSADSASQLRQTKAVRAAVDALPSGHGLAPVAPDTSPFESRRKSPRIHCSGSVEFQIAGSDVRIWGTLTDISLHGCYVEMNETFPLDTPVHLVLKSCGCRVQSAGRVRTSYPALGMGICFTDIDPREQRNLQQLLAMLVGRSSTLKIEPAEENMTKDSLRSAGPTALFDELSEFFQKREMLSREEFLEIVKRTRGF